MKLVIEVYTNGKTTGKYLKAVTSKGIVLTSSVGYAKKYNNAESGLGKAMSDCDTITRLSNNISFGVLQPC